MLRTEPVRAQVQREVAAVLGRLQAEERARADARTEDAVQRLTAEARALGHAGAEARRRLRNGAGAVTLPQAASLSCQRSHPQRRVERWVRAQRLCARLAEGRRGMPGQRFHTATFGCAQKVPRGTPWRVNKMAKRRKQRGASAVRRVQAMAERRRRWQARRSNIEAQLSRDRRARARAHCAVRSKAPGHAAAQRRPPRCTLQPQEAPASERRALSE